MCVCVSLSPFFIQKLTQVQRQHLMSCITDNSERINLLEKTRDIECRQKKRMADLNDFTDKEKDKENKLLEVKRSSTYILDQEEENRKMLVVDMNVNATDSVKPIVKVLNNVQGTMGKMRKNHENTHDIVKENHHELIDLKKEIKEMRSDISDVSFQVKKATFNNVMGGVDLSDFFPVVSTQQLEAFMDKKHPDWHLRRMEFYNFLYNCVTDCKKAFSKGLLKTLFTRQYMMTVKWPNFG